MGDRTCKLKVDSFMKIRTYTPGDCAELADLFYQTVHTVNANDYTREQLDVWATGNVDLIAWNSSFLEHITLVAEEDGRITGFADMDHTGYLDRLYVHREYQGRGIGAALVLELEQQAAAEHICGFKTYASITARPFFQQMGYAVAGNHEVERNGIRLKNFLMVKSIN